MVQRDDLAKRKADLEAENRRIIEEWNLCKECSNQAMKDRNMAQDEADQLRERIAELEAQLDEVSHG